MPFDKELSEMSDEEFVKLFSAVIDETSKRFGLIKSDSSSSSMSQDEKFARLWYDTKRTHFSIPRLGMREATYDELNEATKAQFVLQARAFIGKLTETQESTI